MRLLFDHNVPAPLRRSVTRYDIHLAGERGWHELTNGDLLTAAEQAGFETFLTADQNLRYQRNLAGRLIAIVVLSKTPGRLSIDIPRISDRPSIT